MHAVIPRATQSMGKYLQILRDGQGADYRLANMKHDHPAPVDAQKAFRSLMGRYATGVSVIATSGADGPHGMTANSLTSVSLDPLLLLFCVRHGARTGALVKQTRRFSVNILSHEHEALSRRFAGQKAQCGEIEWTDLFGTPALADAEAVFVCDLSNEYRAGDHLIIVGRVIGMQGRQQARSPLVFYDGSYCSLHASAPSCHALEWRER